MGRCAKKVLVRTDQAETTKDKRVVISDDLKLKMIKPKSPKVGVWKVNERKRVQSFFKPILNFCSTNTLHNGNEISPNILDVSRDLGLQNGCKAASLDRGKATELEQWGGLCSCKKVRFDLTA
jgi:hypothetical protein